MTDLSRASATLRERLLSKIVMPGPATPCATWVGAYNVDGRKNGRKNRSRRPVIKAGPMRGPVLYVAPTMLTLAGVVPDRPDQTEALHSCAPPVNGVYTCVDLRCLRWGSRTENERDKRRGGEGGDA